MGATGGGTDAIFKLNERETERQREGRGRRARGRRKAGRK